MSATRHMSSGRYFGRTLARRRACGLLMVETVYPPGDELPWHSHENPYLLVVLGGALLERSGQRENECARGMLVLNSAREPHRDRIGATGARCLNVELGPTWLHGEGHLAPAPRAAYRFAGRALDAVGRLEAEFRRADACALEVESAVRGLIDEAIGSAVPPPRGAPGWLRRVIEMLHAEPMADVDVRGLASAVGIHPAHLCRTFAARQGCTIGQYLRRLRADRALHAILHTTAPLARVAQEAGFTDQSHLTRAMREFYRTTPARLRRDVCRTPAPIFQP
jgi:AraC family transcriptional regulator